MRRPKAKVSRSLKLGGLGKPQNAMLLDGNLPGTNLSYRATAA